MAKAVTLRDLLQELAEQRNFDFRGYKKTTLERRFRRRMFHLNIGDYGEYGEYIRNHPDEANELLNTILINVTDFFRDPPAWEILRHEILPGLLKRIKPGGNCWSFRYSVIPANPAARSFGILADCLRTAATQFPRPRTCWRSHVIRGSL
jgi:hypothetical protein